ncbi:MAG: LysR family transcriptional regulator [Candidatus Rokuibacteriota bacterium]
MELRHLRYFVAVAEAGAFSRAATRLGITQPALSRQVRDLEGELGVRLFERAGRRVHLTSDGEGLLGRSRELLTAAAQLGEHAQAMRGGQAGILRVGASPQAIQSVLAPFLAHYLKSRPRIEVRLVEEGGLRLPVLVERGDVHVAFGVLRGGEPLEGRLLFAVRTLAVVSATDRLRRSATVDIVALRDQPVLLLRQGFGTRDAFDGACRAARVRPRVVLESGDPQSLVALAEAGRGVAVVPSTVLFSGRHVHAAPILNAGTSLGIWGSIVWDPRRFMPAYARAFIDEITAYTRRTHPGRQYDRRAPPVPRPVA